VPFRGVPSVPPISDGKLVAGSREETGRMPKDRGNWLNGCLRRGWPSTRNLPQAQNRRRSRTPIPLQHCGGGVGPLGLERDTSESCWLRSHLPSTRVDLAIPEVGGHSVNTNTKTDMCGPDGAVSSDLVWLLSMRNVMTDGLVSPVRRQHQTNRSCASREGHGNTAAHTTQGPCWYGRGTTMRRTGRVERLT
jgi:hypothetical protein